MPFQKFVTFFVDLITDVDSDSKAISGNLTYPNRRHVQDRENVRNPHTNSYPIPGDSRKSPDSTTPDE